MFKRRRIYEEKIFVILLLPIFLIGVVGCNGNSNSEETLENIETTEKDLQEIEEYKNKFSISDIVIANDDLDIRKENSILLGSKEKVKEVTDFVLECYYQFQSNLHALFSILYYGNDIDSYKSSTCFHKKIFRKKAEQYFYDGKLIYDRKHEIFSMDRTLINYYCVASLLIYGFAGTNYETMIESGNSLKLVYNISSSNSEANGTLIFEYILDEGIYKLKNIVKEEK